LLILFYLGRLFNLIFYVLCVYAAIRIIPKFKLLFFGIGLMPMALHQAASYSYDGFLNGMAFLFIALIIRAIYRKEKIKRWEYLCLLNVGMLMAPAKLMYSALGLLLFLVPRERFGSLKKKIFALVGLYTAMAAFLIAIWAPSLSTGAAIVPPEGVEPFTVQFIITHPLHSLEVMIWTFKDLAIDWLNQATGYRLSGLTLVIPQYIPSIYFVVLMIMTVRTENEKLPAATVLQRSMFGVLALGVIMLAMFTMMLAWTSMHASQVGGVQGRYFIPIIPLILMMLENKSIQRKTSMDQYLVIAVMLLHVETIDSIITNTIFR
ncbi:MAG: DUF2142 domain-containing protein, partial [Clostridiales bacterium]|nr:DUF2142 domain-containing protein [Clostridiales bacterium]